MKMRKRLFKKIAGERYCQRTKFIQAALKGNLKRMAKMLSNGFDINNKNEDGETAFSWCCQFNKLKSAKFLYENGADINIELKGVATPLDIAMCSSSPYFRKWLKSIGGKRLKEFEGWPWPPAQKHKWK